MHAATSRLPGRSLASFCMVLVLVARLAVLNAVGEDEPSGVRAGSTCCHLLLILIFFFHNQQITTSWTFGLPSSSASNPKYIHTADFIPLDFETRPLLSLVPLSLLDV